MSQTIKLVLPGVPESLNHYAGRENSWEYRNDKKEWTEAVCWVGRSKRPPVPFEKALVCITYRFPNRTRHDPDNYAGKFLLDGLTKAGIIADDSFKHIRLFLDAEEDPGEPQTTIIVRQLPKFAILQKIWEVLNGTC